MRGAKLSIGSVWDTAVEAVRGRMGLLVPIAALTLFLPGVIQAALALYTGGAGGGAVVAPGPGVAALRFALMLGLLALTFWGLCWGLVGMVLAVPLTVMLKIILENIPGTRPFARLMGEE